MKTIVKTLALSLPLAFGLLSQAQAANDGRDNLRVMAGLVTAVAYNGQGHASSSYWDREEVRNIGNVVRKLERQGGKVISIETRGRDYQIIGYNSKGRLITGRVDGHSGKILNIMPYRGAGFFNKRAVSISVVIQNLKREGITDVRKVTLNRTKYLVEAENRRGRDFTVSVNARTGKVEYVRRVQTGGHDTRWN